ncbi:MAG TPA: hypothetical protein RWO66_00965 [Ruminococcus sp.]|nr:hypothetical protein [Ruminococcus sp.]
MIEKFHTYKDYPLVRCGDTIYYGYMADPYVTMINILDKNKETGAAEKVNVILMSTDPSLNPLQACVKNSKRDCGLYEALDVASIWLEKALKN